MTDISDSSPQESHESPPPRTQASRTKVTRQKLLDAALEVLVEEGLEAASTRAIAARAGVTHGAIQHHFGTRQRLIGVAIERWGQGLIQDLVEGSVAGGDERERAVYLLGVLWDFHAEPPGSAVFELFYVGRHDADVAKHTRRGMGTLWELVIGVARELTPSYASRVGYDDQLRLTMAAMRGVVMMEPIGVEDAMLTRERFIELAMASFEALPEA